MCVRVHNFEFFPLKLLQGAFLFSSNPDGNPPSLPLFAAVYIVACGGGLCKSVPGICHQLVNEFLLKSTEKYGIIMVQDFAAQRETGKDMNTTNVLLLRNYQSGSHAP